MKTTNYKLVLIDCQLPSRCWTKSLLYYDFYMIRLIPKCPSSGQNTVAMYLKNACAQVNCFLGRWISIICSVFNPFLFIDRKTYFFAEIEPMVTPILSDLRDIQLNHFATPNHPKCFILTTQIVLWYLSVHHVWVCQRPVQNLSKRSNNNNNNSNSNNNNNDDDSNSVISSSMLNLTNNQF